MNALKLLMDNSVTALFIRALRVQGFAAAVIVLHERLGLCGKGGGPKGWTRGRGVAGISILLQIMRHGAIEMRCTAPVLAGICYETAEFKNSDSCNCILFIIA